MPSPESSPEAKSMAAAATTTTTTATASSRTKPGTATDTQRAATKDAVLRASSKLKLEGHRPASAGESLASTVGAVLHSAVVIGGGLARVAVHLGLSFLFLTLAALWCVQTVHDEYFVPLVERAERSDADLQDQFTYYNRQCNVLDLTASATTEPEAEAAVTDLWVEAGGVGGTGRAAMRHATGRAVDAVMRHGVVMVPAILTDETTERLRDFVVRKNGAVDGTMATVYPLLKGRNRIGIGMEPTDDGDGAIVDALREIHDHELFAGVIKALVGGPNPALVEVTAITARFSAGNQPWHTDTPPGGSALKFGRTYTPVYSLYLPLQNTTGRMGPTDVCLGSHYCADGNMTQLCADHKIGLHEVRPFAVAGGGDGGNSSSSNSSSSSDKIWRRGDGALFNQQLWHKGGQHRDKNAPDNVIFVVTFMGRPTDPRQLPRGAYFRQRWMNWGATWDDMADSGVSMARPWSILRSLHLWKAHDRQWGYDLVTAAAMRLANNQPGMQAEDVARYVDDFLVPLKFPHFLLGTFDWKGGRAEQLQFLRTTLHSCYTFIQAMNVVGHSVFAILLVLTGLVARSRTNRGFLKTIGRGVFRLCGTHVVVALVAGCAMHTLHNSKWAKDIKSGETLMLPFPKVDDVVRPDDPMVSSGLTTFPERFDVLVGTRLNAKYLGAYTQWLDYHPGNLAFGEYVKQYGGKPYQSILRGKSIPTCLADGVVETGINLVERNNKGRFLHQDYRSGDWRMMNAEERREYVQMRLFVGGPDTLWSALKDEIDAMLDGYRFGFQARKAKSLSWHSQLHLGDLGRTLFLAWPRRIDTRKREKILQRQFLNFRGMKIAISAFSLPRARLSEVPASGSKDKSHRVFLAELDEPPPLSQWDEVDFYDPKRDDYFWGTVLGVSNSKNGFAGYDIAMYGIGVKKIGPVLRGIPRNQLVLRTHILEGADVIANFALKGAYYLAVATLVLADGSIDVEYRDGDVELNVAMYNYLPHDTI